MEMVGKCDNEWARKGGGDLWIVDPSDNEVLRSVVAVRTKLLGIKEESSDKNAQPARLRTQCTAGSERAAGESDGHGGDVLDVGTRVLVYFEAVGWCGGVVEHAKGDGLFSVAFDDGTSEDVSQSEMRVEEALRAGKRTKLFDEDELDSVTPDEIAHLEETAAVGQRLLARDSKGIWCEAKVVAERRGKRGKAADQAAAEQSAETKSEDEQGPWELKVHFHGWGSRFDEWIRSGSGRLLTLPLEATCGVGDRLCARDGAGIWSEATVVEVREARGPEPRQLLVHFVGDDDADHADEWIGVESVGCAGCR